MAKSRVILITRKLKNDSALKNWAHHQGYTLNDISFIKTIPVKGLKIPETDWIFFSSPSAVRCFFEEYTLKQKRIASLGKATASVLADYGYQADFIGDDEKTPSEIGKEFFDKRSGNESIFFPLSNLSQRNVLSHQGNRKVIELNTYHTLPIQYTLSEKPDVIIFTSPSNIESYCSTNELTLSDTLVAIGKTTAAALENLGFRKIIVSSTPREEDLIAALQSLE
ncbi:MAG: uroporphyrinogen-III synthase [Crocinitomicaceae bacterium]|nr:uroporphyrinogen-III synthase [Crocinitomicaceae bacterium]MBK8927615.1 uroporphyrinogen-III synthase [Crocinitomicaceae bacterium]